MKLSLPKIRFPLAWVGFKDAKPVTSEHVVNYVVSLEGGDSVVKRGDVMEIEAIMHKMFYKGWKHNRRGMVNYISFKRKGYE